LFLASIRSALYLGPYGPLFSLYFNIWVRSPPALFRKKSKNSTLQPKLCTSKTIRPVHDTGRWQGPGGWGGDHHPEKSPERSLHGALTVLIRLIIIIPSSLSIARPSFSFLTGLRNNCCLHCMGLRACRLRRDPPPDRCLRPSSSLHLSRRPHWILELISAWMLKPLPN
jgi:hypothetical protein